MKGLFKQIGTALAAGFLTAMPVMAQDSIWIKYDNRFLPHRPLVRIDDCDSIGFRSSGIVPVLRRYSDRYASGYADMRLNALVNTPGTLVFGKPEDRQIYRPAEFNSMDFMDESSKWCFKRSRESEHFIVFWEAGFGDNPGSTSVPSGMRVDIDDLLKKAEQFYATNVNRLKMVVTDEGTSQLDRYKMEIYLLYQTEWLATGSGYDNKVGALWVNPSTCQPVGSTIAHEIGHSFQYQTYCDNLLKGKPDDLKSGFRYGYPGSNGGCGFWEQCAQWQSYQDYPSQTINNYHFTVWMANHHRHFEHEWQRYASYWLQYYMTEKNGITALGRIWNESRYPEDAIQAYTRIFCGGDYDEVRRQLFEYAQKAATFDFDAIRKYVGTAYDSYTTNFVSAPDGWWQVTYDNCPAPTGFNVIPLDVPASGTVVTVDLQGLASGSPLPVGDPGKMVDGDGAVVGTATSYNATAVAGSEGWAFGFVAMNAGGTRVYGDTHYTAADMTGHAEFTVPTGAARLFLVVQGSPIAHRQCPWDDKEETDDQLPYRVKVDGTNLKDYIYIDPDTEVKNIDLTYNLTCSSTLSSYNQGTIDLSDDGSIAKIAEAFALQPSSIASMTAAIANGSTGVPAEGNIVLGLEDAAGNVSYAYTANAGFYCLANGSRGTWAAHAPLWFEYNKDNFVITYGHYPGYTTSKKRYTVRPVLVYTKDGVQYKARLTLNMYYDMAIPSDPDEPGTEDPVEVTAENAKYHVARLNIVTENGAAITGKDKADYVNCTITVDSDYDEWDSGELAGRIRGRGNSTWLWYDKKPYRIKLNSKASILGLDKEKDWVLLANYRDPTDMMNTFAFCMGEGMGLPFTNHSRFVEVTLNGDYIGVYQLTEQVEVGAGRVDIDEISGILLSLDLDDGPDLAPDAGDNFKSSVYGLPVCVKSPEDQTAAQLDSLKAEFAPLEQAIKDHNMTVVRQYLDVEDFMKYMIVQMLVYNVEMAAPRSVFIYRDGGETQWHAGPLWDFDAGYDFDWGNMYTGHDFFADFKETILGSDPANHNSTYPDVPSFFTDLWKSAEFVAAFQQYWESIKGKIISEYWAETRKYADGAKEALERDAVRWPIGKDVSSETNRMESWIRKRMSYMNALIQNYPKGE